MAQDDVCWGQKRSKRTASLPDEMIDEILLLLPARSVRRFRGVCRQWAARLSSPAFMEAYDAKAQGRRMRKMVVFAPSPGRRSTTAYSCSSQGVTAAADPLFSVDNLRTDFLSLSSRPWRGLMLLSDSRRSDYWVCNPSTGECRALPQQRHRGLTLSSVGLVLDDRTKEFKVVHLFMKMLMIGFGCEVYTLGDGDPGCRRRWRPPTAGLESLEVNTMGSIRALQTEDAVTKTSPVAADGFLHWLIYPSRGGAGAPAGQISRQQDDILRFSAADESFDFISAPPRIIDTGEGDNDVWLDAEHFPAVPFHLAELQGSLCMIHDLRRRQRGSIDVWVRNGACREWSLDYRVAVTPLLARDVGSPRFITLLGCYPNNRSQDKKGLLLFATSEHKVYSYDPDSGGVKMVFSAQETDIVGLHKEAPAGLWLGMYEDSLVRIGGEEEKDPVSSLAVRQILLQLPLKSIARAMLVCKKWCVLIESSSFVAAHLSISTMKRPTSILMATNCNGRARRAFFAFAPLESWLEQAATSSSSSSLDLLVDGSSKAIICSKPCHGLNLISTSSDDYLCNPGTGAIECLGIRGRSRFSSPRHQHPTAGHAFSVGRNIGFGFYRSTGEHVAVEIGYLGGTLACMVKASESDAWTCVGTPPMPVTDMPPAHVDGTLYWLGEQDITVVVVVAYDISTRVFGVLKPCLINSDLHHDMMFLVELNQKLALVALDRDEEVMEVWTMQPHEWVHASRIRLRGQLDFSPRTNMVVVPLEVSRDGRKILLNTGRALGYYDTKTEAMDTVYSLRHLQFPPSSLAFPVLYQESLVRVPEDSMLLQVTDDHGRRRRTCEHPEHAGGGGEKDGALRPIFQECQTAGCLGNGEIHSSCCKRVICRLCIRRCREHFDQRDHLPLNNLYDDVMEGIHRHGLSLEHPFVPDPDYYCYYYSAINNAGDVARHVFVSIMDLAQGKEVCHLTDCAYRMDQGGAVRDTWVRRYLKIDPGHQLY